jgi:hypothetical protein
VPPPSRVCPLTCSFVAPRSPNLREPCSARALSGEVRPDLRGPDFAVVSSCSYAAMPGSSAAVTDGVSHTSRGVAQSCMNHRSARSGEARTHRRAEPMLIANATPSQTRPPNPGTVGPPDTLIDIRVWVRCASLLAALRLRLCAVSRHSACAGAGFVSDPPGPKRQQREGRGRPTRRPGPRPGGRLSSGQAPLRSAAAAAARWPVSRPSGALDWSAGARRMGEHRQPGPPLHPPALRKPLDAVLDTEQASF